MDGKRVACAKRENKYARLPKGQVGSRLNATESFVRMHGRFRSSLRNSKRIHFAVHTQIVELA